MRRAPLSVARIIPIVVAVILAGTLVYAAMAAVPQVSAGLNVSVRVGYPDSLDESDVSDMYAYQLLATQGIHVTPTFYDAPPLSYKGLISGQQDVAFDTSAQTMALGPAQGQQTTCVTSYALAGVFLAIAGQGITSPQQMIGKAVDDFGPGSSTRSLDLYWYSQAGINVTQDASSPAPGTVLLRNIGGNIERVSDLESKGAAAIVVDDFILSDFQGSKNTTANGGPFHVLGELGHPFQQVFIQEAVCDDRAGVHSVGFGAHPFVQDAQKIQLDPDMVRHHRLVVES